MEQNQTKNYAQMLLEQNIEIIKDIDTREIEAIVQGLVALRTRKGRLFILGVGGSAGHASHAVCDFRKTCQIEAYTITDNVSELTARINDDGWDTCFVEWLKESNLNQKDALLIFSVGGGNKEKNISNNLVLSMELAREVGASIFGIVGRDGGFTKQVAHSCVVIPPKFSDKITPHTEGLCALIWHVIASHPNLQLSSHKWESTK